MAPAVEAEVLGVVDAAGSTDVTAPRAEGIERGPAAAGEVQPGAGGARGSVEYLGIYLEKDPNAPFFKTQRARTSRRRSPRAAQFESRPPTGCSRQPSFAPAQIEFKRRWPTGRTTHSIQTIQATH